MAAIWKVWRQNRKSVHRRVFSWTIRSNLIPIRSNTIRYNWVIGCFEEVAPTTTTTTTTTITTTTTTTARTRWLAMWDQFLLSNNSLKLRRLRSQCVVDSGERECGVSALPRASLWYHLLHSQNLDPCQTSHKRYTLSRNFFLQYFIGKQSPNKHGF